MLMSVWPFGIQQNWNIVSIVMIVISYSLLFGWVGFTFYFPTDLSIELKMKRNNDEANEKGLEERILRKVHRISAYCLVMETLGIIVGVFM